MPRKTEEPSLTREIFTTPSDSQDRKQSPDYKKWATFVTESAGKLNFAGSSPESSLPSGEPWQKLQEGVLEEGGSDKEFWVAKRMSFKKHNGNFGIEERVIQKAVNKADFFYSEEEGFEKVKTESEVIIYLSENKRIRLNDMLPPGYTFRPDLNSDPYRRIMARARNEAEEPVVKLQDYNGADKVEGFDFALDESKKQIKYRNLSQAGAFVALLHEIGHAWDMYHNHRAIGVTENMLQLQAIYRKLQPVGSSPQMSEDNIRLRRVGRNNTSHPLIVNKDAVVKLFKEMVDAEQGPSEYAVAVIKFLRKRGYDLEPNMTDSDFLKSVSVGLNNYQYEFESFLYSEDDKNKLKPYSFLNLQKEFDFKS